MPTTENAGEVLFYERDSAGRKDLARGVVVFKDMSYAVQPAAQAPLVATSAAQTLAQLLTSAHGTDAASCPLTAVPDWAQGVRISVDGASGIRYRTDGVAPTASKGAPIAAGVCGFTVAGRPSVLAMQIISQGGDDNITVEFLG